MNILYRYAYVKCILYRSRYIYIDTYIQRYIYIYIYRDAYRYMCIYVYVYECSILDVSTLQQNTCLYMYIYITAHAYRELMENDWTCMCIHVYVFDIGYYAQKNNVFVYNISILMCIYVCIEKYIYVDMYARVKEHVIWLCKWVIDMYMHI